MTPRRTDPDLPDPDRTLSDAESEAVGRRIRELAQTVQAPGSLRARLADGQGDLLPARAPRPRWRRAGRPRLALGAVAGAMAAVIVAVLLVSGGGASGPSVDDAAALALARPTAAAPAVNSGGTQLDASVGGVAFPNYAYQWPAWKATGTRRDTVAGRAATTVVYRGPRGDVGYTIVDGKPLPEPKGAREIRAGGQTLYSVTKGDATVVTWRQGGHTCVLAARGPGVERQLVRFATWA